MSSDENSCERKRQKFISEKPVKEASTDIDDDVDLYGPALPPHLIQHKEIWKSDDDSFGSRLPQNYGNEQSERKVVYGPQLPNERQSGKVIGPEIPPHLISTDIAKEEDEVSSEEDPDYGPSVSLMSDGTSGMETLPSSLKKAKGKGPSELKAKRESWMVELPEERANCFGLGPRQFRKRVLNEKDSDRSGWTETPLEKGSGLNEAEKARRNDEKIISQKQIDERNEEMERLVRKISKKEKTEESLLEIHRKKMRKKEKKEAKRREKDGKTAERRPFDRNVDLQIQRFDMAQRNAVLKKAALLNDRFAAGESKFL